MSAPASKTTYRKAFYETRHAQTSSSAQSIVSHMMQLVNPHSVIDMGCGVGTWLKAFQEKGVPEVMGLEGEWLDIRQLAIDPGSFKHWDLKQVHRPERRYDLALSLEVGEHIHEAESDNLIESLTLAAPMVLFGAAIPGQGGVDHVNEKWPTFWMERFARRGYVCVDAVRPVFWDDPKVKVWYKQNTFLYVHRDLMERSAQLLPYYRPESRLLDAVHPDLFIRQLGYRHPMHISYKDLIRFFPAATWQAIKRFAKR